MDAELAAKAAAKHDPALEREAREFLEGLCGQKIEGDLGDALHDGVLLCMAVNAVQPKAVRRINKSRMPFKQMENITNFIKACRGMGMREYDLFTTVALYEKKDMNSVINGIIAFGRKAKTKGFAGTGPKEATKNVRKPSKNWGGGGGVSKLNMGSAGIMERNKGSASNDINFGAKAGGGRKYGGGGTVSKLNMGSAGIMERSKASASNDINFGAKAGNAAKAGGGSGYTGRKWGTSGTVSKLNMGSAGVMERSAVSKANNINFGAQAGGGGGGAGVSRMNMGNYGVQQRAQENYTSRTQKMGYYRG